jgi:DNA-binding transcriptional LysR family regulator
VCAGAGGGSGLLPRLVGAAVAAGDLVAVLPDHRTDTAPLRLVHPARVHVPLAVRALRDHLLRRFPR